MSDTSRNENNEWIWKLLSVIVPIICVILTHILTDISTQATFVERLSVYFDVVDENMSYEQAIKTMRDESQKIKNDNGKLKKQIAELQSQISSVPEIQFKNPAIIVDGLKTQENTNNSVVTLDGTNYYSQNMLNMILDNNILYNMNDNTIYYAKNEKSVSTETKVKLLDTNVLYDGVGYDVYLPSNGDSFSMGSDTYNEGFVLYDNHSILGEGDGYALFELKRQYSKIAFDVGRTNEYEMQDVELKVYLDNKYIEVYSLNAQSPPVPLEINLNYANSLKLEITGGSKVKYGFTDVILYY